MDRLVRLKTHVYFIAPATTLELSIICKSHWYDMPVLLNDEIMSNSDSVKCVWEQFEMDGE